MINSVLHFIVQFFEYGIFFYCMLILSSYLIISIISAKIVTNYTNRRKVLNPNTILSSPYQPSISIIAPAYNEEVTIVDNIRSLLSLHYNNLTIIIVNDGSKDDTLQAAIDNYDLYQSDEKGTYEVKTKEVRGIYRSHKKAFNKLIVIDKHNGGKADAINVGINASKTDYFACIDVDCIIDQDAFLRLVEPIMKAGDKTIGAVGGIVWLTNDADIKSGKVTKLRTPKSYIARIQVIEYFRAFLLGRPAWASFNGMLLISGAFGIFHRKTVLTVGGYNHNTVGEDMELVMRMHAYYREHKIKYAIEYLPDPLCWTEAPSDYQILGRQRNRWTRGTIECLQYHKKMCLNSKYGALGIISYPYWLIAEWFAPFAEAGGILFVIILGVLGLANWPLFFSLLLLVYLFAVTISIFAILIQNITYHKYESLNDIWLLILTALQEPFLYHPKTVKWSIKGNYDKFTGQNKGWGEMTRKGFAKKV